VLTVGEGENVEDGAKAGCYREGEATCEKGDSRYFAELEGDAFVGFTFGLWGCEGDVGHGFFLRFMMPPIPIMAAITEGRRQNTTAVLMS